MQQEGFHPFTGGIEFEHSLPDLSNEEVRRDWIKSKQNEDLINTIWNHAKEKYPEKYRDGMLYYHELKNDGLPNEQGNLVVQTGKIPSQYFYVPDLLSTGDPRIKEVIDELGISQEQIEDLLQSMDQVSIFNPSSIAKTNDGKDNYGQMGSNTAVEGELQCIGAALKEIEGTDPPQFDLEKNVRNGIKTKLGLDSEVGELVPVGVARWKKTPNGPVHTTFIYEAQLPEMSSEQLKEHAKGNKAQISAILTVDPRNLEKSAEVSDRLPQDGQRAYVSGLVRERSREYERSNDKGILPRIMALTGLKGRIARRQNQLTVTQKQLEELGAATQQRIKSTRQEGESKKHLLAQEIAKQTLADPELAEKLAESLFNSQQDELKVDLTSAKQDRDRDFAGIDQITADQITRIQSWSNSRERELKSQEEKALVGYEAALTSQALKEASPTRIQKVVGGRAANIKNSELSRRRAKRFHKGNKNVVQAAIERASKGEDQIELRGIRRGLTRQGPESQERS